MSLRVLAVDDDPAILSAIEFALGFEGFDVITARDGDAALVAIRESKPDVVLLDVMMPKLSGLDVVKTLREDPAIASTPVILVTAKASEEEQWLGWQVGGDSYITKPYDIEQLLKEIHRVTHVMIRGAA